jgi:hypothetical protein
VSGAGDAGLITLEWLLIVGAIAGLAASSVLVVQRVIDDTAEVPADPVVRLLEADIEAASVASDAQVAFDADRAGYVDADAPFAARCDPGIATDFSDVVDHADWTAPADPDGTPDNADDVPARCVVTPKPGLGG